MSNRQKQEAIEFARRAAMEAATDERLRCLWVLDRLLQQCAKGLDDKLIAASQLQLVKVRYELTRTIVNAAKGLIASGIRPAKATLTPGPGNDKPPEQSEIVVPEAKREDHDAK